MTAGAGIGMLRIDRQTFIRRYLLTISIATFAIPAIGALVDIFLGVYNAGEIISAVLHYTVFYILAVYILGIYLTHHFLSRYSLDIESALQKKDIATAKRYVRKISTLIIYNLIFILLYTQGGPTSVNYHIYVNQGRTLSNTELFLSYFTTLPTILLILFPVYFRLYDLLGKYLAPRGVVFNLLPIGIKILISGMVIPLLIDLVLMLFFHDRTGYFSSETLFLWFALISIAAAGAWFTYNSFRTSLRPLQGTLHAKSLDQIDHLTTTPNSLDEIGILAQGWQTLLKKFRETNQALVEERNFSTTIINNANALFVVLDREGNIIEFNKGCEKTTGYQANEVLGQKVWDYFIVPEEVHAVKQVFKNLKDEPINSSYKNYWRIKNDGRRLIDWSNSSIADANGQVVYVISIGIDITDRNIIEDELRRSKDTLDRAQAIAHIGHWDWDIVTNDLAWSDEIYRIFGLQPQEFEATYPAFLEHIFADDVEKVTSAVNASVANAEIPYNVEHRIIHPNGEIRYVHEQGEIYRDNSGKPLRMVGTVLDITDRVKAEEHIRKLNTELEQRVQERTIELEATNQHLAESLRELQKTQQHLIQSEKMVALGGLVAGVAHEINTPIGIGVTAVSHLKMKMDQFNESYKNGQLTKDDFEKLVKTANDSTTILENNLKRAADLIRSFKQIAVDQSSEKMRLVNLYDYTNEILHSLHPKLSDGDYKIKNHTNPSLQINSYPGAISQILTNLIINSLIHGFSGNKKGEIDIGFTLQDENIHLEYRDNGKGISREHVGKIFDPFFTTYRDGGSSGLGMNIIYNIVTQTLGGNIEVESEPGHGVLFTITFKPLGDDHVES